MKYFAIIFLLISTFTLSQKTDSKDIAFKAKLLTLDRHGVLNEDKLLEDITNQKLEFIEYNDFSNWVFMKIDFNQIYGNYIDNNSILWLGNCSFYIAFRNENSKFYRLGGFDALDINDFIKDLRQDIEYIPILSNENLNEIIDINCMESFFEMTEKKKFKKGYQCYSPCSEKLSTTLIVN